MRSRKDTGDGEALRFDVFAPPPLESEVTPLPPEPDPEPEPERSEVVATRRIGWTPEVISSEPVEEIPLPGETADTALSIAEYYGRVGFALRREFPADVWVTGEIRKVTVKNGHRYIELADHHTPGERGVATLDVACWSRDWPLIAADLEAVGIDLAAGLVVRLRGRPSVYEAGARLRFTLTELDVQALLGGIAAARRRLLHTLETEGLLEVNRRLPAPVVPMRVGVVTSAGSEAYRDFTGQLERSGFAFEVRLEACLVQGRDAPPQIAAAVRRLHRFGPDVIVLVRGGGAKGDLLAFDSEEVARAICGSRHPIWTGIGHTGDRSVADELAQRALVTPTACGEAVVEAVETYLASVTGRALTIAERGRRAIEHCERSVAGSRSELGRAARHELGRAAGSLNVARSSLAHCARAVTVRSGDSLRSRSVRVGSLARHGVEGSEKVLAHRRQILDAYDPTRQLGRGWSLTRSADGRIIRSVSEVAVGAEIVTAVADGTIGSVVKETGHD